MQPSVVRPSASAKSSSSWYESFLSNLSPPPPFLSQHGPTTAPIFYALRVGKMEFGGEIPRGELSINLLFFHFPSRRFFGHQCQWINLHPAATESRRTIEIDSTLLFQHSSPALTEVLIVGELVAMASNRLNPYVLGWFALQLPNTAVTDFGTASVQGLVPQSRIPLYRGSCQALLHVGTLKELDAKVPKLPNMALHALLQTHQAVGGDVADYLPEFHLVQLSDEGISAIPGLSLSTGSRLPVPLPIDYFTAIIDNLSLSAAGEVAASVESRILETLRRDYCYKANRPPHDAHVPQLMVIERRLRVGVHNSLVYSDEPICLYLTASSGGHRPLSTTESPHQAAGSSRRRSRSLSREEGAAVDSGSRDYLQARNSVRLTSLSADERVAIVFCLDYLVGFVRGDGTILESQLALVGWNAWCPYRHGSFTLNDTVSLQLVGGPRPNPDHQLCMRLRDLYLQQKPGGPNPIMRRQLSSDLPPMGVELTLRFNFAIVHSSNANDALLRVPQSSGVVARSSSQQQYFHSSTQERMPISTPQPRPDVVGSDVKKEQQRRDEWIEEPISHPVAKTQSTFGREDPDAGSPTLLQPIQPPPAYSQPSPLPRSRPIADIPRVCRPSRQISLALARHPFPQIADSRSATVVDPARVLAPNALELELQSALPTSELSFQFMALGAVQNAFYRPDTARRQRYFFTLKFYRFPAVSTETLAGAGEGDGLTDTGLPVLMRVDEAGKEVGSGFVVKFTVDPSISIPSDDSDDFARYMLMSQLCIDVWEADSLIHVGSVHLPLRFLCRLESDSIISTLQGPVLKELEGVERSPILTAVLFLQVANVGRPASRGKYTQGMAKKQVLCSIANAPNVDGEKGNLLHQRARPLNHIHESALQRYLTTQKLDIRQRKEELFSSENLHRLQRWNELKSQKSISGFANGLSSGAGKVKRFVFEEELEAYRTIRRESKAAKLLQAVFRGITAIHAINAKFAQPSFFEYRLQNTFAEQVVCVVAMPADPRLQLISDRLDEWRHWKAAHGLKTPLERDLVQRDTGTAQITLLLNAMESVYVPFRYDPWVQTHDASLIEEYPSSSELRVIFKRLDGGEPIGILEVLVHTRHYAATRSHRWTSEENARLERCLSIEGTTRRVLSARCQDPNVACVLRTEPGGRQSVALRTHGNEAGTVRSFLVALYADKFHAELVELWQFTLHSMLRVNVEAVQAQPTRIHLPMAELMQRLRENQSTGGCMLQFHSSSQLDVALRPHQPFSLTSPQVLDELVHITLRPNFTGQALFLLTTTTLPAGTTMGMPRLEASWLVAVRVAEPNIVRSYRISIPANETAEQVVVMRRIQFENPYEVGKTFRLYSSDPSRLSVKSEFHHLEARERTEFELELKRRDGERSQVDGGSGAQLLLFVEDMDSGRQEEAYEIVLDYDE